MPVFTSTNVGLAVLHHEHAFTFLALLARLELRHRGRRRRRLRRSETEARPRRPRLVDRCCPSRRTSARGPSSTGSAPTTTCLLGGRRDLGRAREAGPHFGNLAVDRDRDLEVRRRARGAGAGGLDRAVADLGDLAGEHPIGNRVDLDLRDLAQSARTGCRFRRLRLRPRSPTCRRRSAAPCRRCSSCRSSRSRPLRRCGA